MYNTYVYNVKFTRFLFDIVFFFISISNIHSFSFWCLKIHFSSLSSTYLGFSIMFLPFFYSFLFCANGCGNDCKTKDRKAKTNGGGSIWWKWNDLDESERRMPDLQTRHSTTWHASAHWPGVDLHCSLTLDCKSLAHDYLFFLCYFSLNWIGITCAHFAMLKCWMRIIQWFYLTFFNCSISSFYAFNRYE